MPIEFETVPIKLPTDRYVIFCLKWALWKAEHGQWDHCRQNVASAVSALKQLCLEEVK